MAYRWTGQFNPRPKLRQRSRWYGGMVVLGLDMSRYTVHDKSTVDNLNGMYGCR